MGNVSEIMSKAVADNIAPPVKVYISTYQTGACCGGYYDRFSIKEPNSYQEKDLSKIIEVRPGEHLVEIGTETMDGCDMNMVTSNEYMHLARGIEASKLEDLDDVESEITLYSYDELLEMLVHR